MLWKGAGAEREPNSSRISRCSAGSGPIPGAFSWTTSVKKTGYGWERKTLNFILKTGYKLHMDSGEVVENVLLTDQIAHVFFYTSTYKSLTQVLFWCRVTSMKTVWMNSSLQKLRNPP